MIISEKSNRPNRPNQSYSRWLQVCILLCALLVLPVSLVYAQNYDAIERRLGEGVSEGELSLKQALVMMEALKETCDEDDEDEDLDDEIEEWIESVGNEIWEAFEEGKISKEDAQAKWNHFKKHEVAPKIESAVQEGDLSEEDAREIWEEMEDEYGDDDHDENIEREIGEWIGSVGQEIREAFETGKITEKEAWAKWIHFKEKEVGPKLRALVSEGELTGENAREIWQGIEKTEAGERIKAAVAKGEITEEEARDKWAAINKEGLRKKEHGQDRVKAHLANVKRELGEAVKAGRISREDAARRYQAAEKDVKRRMAEQDRHHDSRRISKEDYARAEREIKKAVAHGRISAKDARARLQEMRNMMGKQSDHGEKTDWDNIKKRIEGAVKAGKMTRKQADEKYREIKKQSSSRAKRPQAQ